MMKPPAPLRDNFGSMLDRKQDCSTIKHNEDDNKVEVHLDTSGYKPDELKVQVEGHIVRVEGKHEERSEAGTVMVSRQFVKEYALPEGSKPEGVESSLSKDGEGEQAVRQGVRPSRGEQAGGRREQSQQGRSAGHHHAKAKEGPQHGQE